MDCNGPVCWSFIALKTLEYDFLSYPSYKPPEKIPSYISLFALGSLTSFERIWVMYCYVLSSSRDTCSPWFILMMSPASEKPSSGTFFSLTKSLSSSHIWSSYETILEGCWGYFAWNISFVWWLINGQTTFKSSWLSFNDSSSSSSNESLLVTLFKVRPCWSSKRRFSSRIFNFLVFSIWLYIFLVCETVALRAACEFGS